MEEKSTTTAQVGLLSKHYKRGGKRRSTGAKGHTKKVIWLKKKNCPHSGRLKKDGKKKKRSSGRKKKTRTDSEGYKKKTN